MVILNSFQLVSVLPLVQYGFWLKMQIFVQMKTQTSTEIACIIPLNDKMRKEMTFRRNYLFTTKQYNSLGLDSFVICITFPFI